MRPEASERWAAWPFVISAVVLGMPHGSLDLRLALRLRESWGRRGVLAGGYVAMSAAAFAVLWWVPLVAIVAFGLLTVVHFGAADARDAAMIAGREPGRGVGRGVAFWLTAVGRGTFVLAMPFAWDASGSMLPVQTALELLGREGVSYAEAAVRGGGAIGVGVGLVCVVGGVGGVGGVVLAWEGASSGTSRSKRASDNRRLLMTHVGELAVLGAGAAMLEPMFFVGLYFLCWHSVRHLRRAAVLSGDAAVRPARTAVRQHAWSLPLLLPTLAVYAAIGHAAIGWSDPMAWAVLLLLMFVVLTPPHHLLVERAVAVALDGERRVAA